MFIAERGRNSQLLVAATLHRLQERQNMVEYVGICEAFVRIALINH
jgi:hypothetical protein